VVIVAHRYGWVPSAEDGGDGEKSITWHEVEAAHAAGRPVFAFLVANDATWYFPKEHDRLVDAQTSIEAEAIWHASRQLQAFKSYLSNRFVRDTFDTPKDLAYKITSSLASWLLEFRLVDGSPAASTSLAVYRTAVIERFEELDWAPRSVRIMVKDQAGALHDARDYILRWARHPSPPLAFLVGDFGSGKSGLLQWLARTLANDETTVPAVVALGRLQRGLPHSLPEVQALVSPPLPREALDSPEALVLLLDGLDEAVDPTSKNKIDYLDALIAFRRLFPAHTRILVTCRTAAFEPLSENLPEAMRAGDARDTFQTTEDAISRALGRAAAEHVVLRICDLDPKGAEEYLLGSEAAEAWKRLGSKSSYLQLANRPFILRLLEKALPYLSAKATGVELDQLFDIAIRAWLLRDRYCGEEDIDRLTGRLFHLARSAWGAASPGQAIMEDRLLVHAGLLRTREDGLLEFAFFSIYEFALAKCLLDDLLVHDASLLARLNLITGYNVNRFLVPMLKRAVVEPQSPQTKPEMPLSEGFTPLVSEAEYARFIEGSGWRSGIGHGWHPRFMAPDGTAYRSGGEPAIFSISDLEGAPKKETDPITSISWYDAVLCCRWFGGRLPLVAELEKTSGFSTGPDLYEWCWEWYDEERSHIRVLACRREPGGLGVVVGVNPDFRHSRIGFRVVFEPVA